jgi:hypothetical protein
MSYELEFSKQTDGRTANQRVTGLLAWKALSDLWLQPCKRELRVNAEVVHLEKCYIFVVIAV